jgi:anti-sigma factor RsiW
MQSNLHNVAPEDLMAYLEGELPVEHAAEIAAHLPECRECQILAAELKSVSEGLTAWTIESKEPQISPGLAEALDEREQRLSSGHSIRHWNWLRTLKPRPSGPWIGGALAGGLAVLLFFTVMTFSPKSAQPRLATFERAATNAGPAATPVPPESSGVRESMASKAVSQMSDADALLLAKRQQEAQVSSNLEVNHIPERGSEPPSAPMILRTAQVTVITQDVDKARAGMDKIVQKYSGYVGDLSAAAPSDGPRKLTATLRVPAAQLDAALAEIKSLGRVESESQNGQDVTAQYVDLEARLSNARNTEQRLIDLLRQRTGKLSDVLEVETELSRVREEIDRMEGERRLMAKQVEFATLTATLSEEFKASSGGVRDSLGTRFRNAGVDGYQSVVNFVIGVALFLVSDGPMLLLWIAILFFPARLACRKLRNR